MKGTPLVLRDLSSIPSGQFAAFVGQSGSGKSLLFRMLLGFEKPESGSIYCDIFTNIVGWAPLTIDDAWEAARMAGLHEDLRNVPMGMRAVVTEGVIAHWLSAILHADRIFVIDKGMIVQSGTCRELIGRRGSPRNWPGGN